jgi:glycosyltransferase involved in cell wall biosynthesis
VRNENEVPLKKPRVSIGLPVYNGEKFLEETLDSLLAQTFTDFEIVISDNASTDLTESICRSYAQQDDRIKFHRNTVNMGAAENYNLVFHLAQGEYFKWAAADDLLAPEFLEYCVMRLDQDSDVVLSYTRTEEIDEFGNTIQLFPARPNCGSPKPSTRFYETVCVSVPVVSVFGLIRSDILRQTRLIGKYSGSDRPLLGELCLHGRFYENQETLFFYRKHEDQSWGGNKSRHAQQSWYDPSRKGKITFPHWRLLGEHLRSIRRSPLAFLDRAQCYLCMVWWIRRHWRFLGNNLILRDVKN